MSDSIETSRTAHEGPGAAHEGSGAPFPAPGPAAGVPAAGHTPVPGDGEQAGSEAAGTGVTGAAAEEPYDPAAPAPLGVERVSTGHAGIDAHLERLADADHLPADGHLEVYEDVHRGLRSTLTTLDARPDDSYDHRS
ncbi:hypothetical protein [Streptomyces wuyuanensis]|uniref:Uncharacterized protein n=1 Tax=Streptomyces wuyuanensis TaxID=1196353 RepID=A0A1H0D3D7_9ACTN|nr:hypothetical protein [Streptomyces wuyuanensis]SDN64637.1 hypothetical protein SAMN05444921_13211 [Streptomyces wuyuanensis]